MERNVVITGWGQITQPKKLTDPALDLISLMAHASLKAAEVNSSPDIFSSIQGIMVVKPGSHHYNSPDKLLAGRLNVVPKLSFTSGIGGNTPQTLINRAAGMIARNEIDSILIAGAECYVQRSSQNKSIKSALFDNILENYKGDDIVGSTPLENQHGIEHPLQGFPLFETALWAESGKSLNNHLKKVGKMWSEFSRVASQNPYAWSKNFRSPMEIITPGPLNRPIAFPYTKYMNSFVTVDQAAAIIIMDEDTATKHQISNNRQTVYFTGGGYARDSQRFLIEKTDFTSSRPLEAAVGKALERSCLTMDNIQSFDLYSCFPCAVSIAKKMLKISDDDPRSLTQTGGLGFFGGPGNNYSLHAVATLAEKISRGETENGLITALSWFLHKHAAGVYSSKPVPGAIKNYDILDKSKPLVGDMPVAVKVQCSNTGIIETYTIIYNKNHQPEYAVIYGKTEDKYRFIAQTENHPDIFKQLSENCCVGQRVKIVWNSDKQKNIVEFY